jgi:hypothetical protein
LDRAVRAEAARCHRGPPQGLDVDYDGTFIIPAHQILQLINIINLIPEDLDVSFNLPHLPKLHTIELRLSDILAAFPRVSLTSNSSFDSG